MNRIYRPVRGLTLVVILAGAAGMTPALAMAPAAPVARFQSGFEAGVARVAAAGSQTTRGADSYDLELGFPTGIARGGFAELVLDSTLISWPFGGGSGDVLDRSPLTLALVDPAWLSGKLTLAAEGGLALGGTGDVGGAIGGRASYHVTRQGLLNTMLVGSLENDGSSVIQVGIGAANSGFEIDYFHEAHFGGGVESSSVDGIQIGTRFSAWTFHHKAPPQR